MADSLFLCAVALIVSNSELIVLAELWYLACEYFIFSVCVSIRTQSRLTIFYIDFL